MALFDRIKSGIPDMDQALDHLRLGDDVVWNVCNLEEFKLFVEPFVDQGIQDGRNVVYLRFASHDPLVAPREGLTVIPMELTPKFEKFTIQIHKIMRKQEKGTLLVFDCLSELQAMWATDMMMGNFFKLTCPVLEELEQVAYFPLIQGKHSYDAIANIRDTSNLFVNVFSQNNLERVYVRPIKIQNRYNDTMFLPHAYNPKTKSFKPITNSVEATRFYSLMNAIHAESDDQNLDSWERFIRNTKTKYKMGLDVTDECATMCDFMLTRDDKLRVLVKENFTARDYFKVRSMMIGTGMIGGKAAGMLLARKLIQNKRPDIYERLEPHDTFYIGSDVFYSYIVENGFWDIRVRQRTEEEYFSLAEEFANRIYAGHFSVAEKDEFRRLLDYYVQDPIIVRSSSILEDGFGNAFAGKYESVFCSNSGTPEERLEEFENAVRTVYASMVSLSALDYRRRRGLENRDEQMALLVMRVSGSHYDDFFMPCAAGVGYSYSPYKMMANSNQKAGMLRLVMGLGTGAVDRTQGSYPRLVSMDRPEMTPYTTMAEKHKYSQRKVDVVNVLTGDVESRELKEIKDKIPLFMQKTLLSRDFEREAFFRDRGQKRQISFVSCEGLVKNKNLMEDLQGILQCLQEAYEYPVDIEYTINFSESGEYAINLLQCRPLQVAKDESIVNVPKDVPKEKILLESFHTSMGLSRKVKIDTIVHIDPVRYYNMPYNDKYRIAAAVSKINWYYRDKGKHQVLLAPGRIGTSSPELGVPTTFSDISEFDIVAEVSDFRTGYMPELSYGSHIFQDLVEAGILYTAIFDEDDRKSEVYQPDLLDGAKNILLDIIPEAKDLVDIITVFDVSDLNCVAYYDFRNEHMLCTFSGLK